MSVQELKEEALKLPAEDREELAWGILKDLHDSETEQDDISDEELFRRMEDIRLKRVPLRPAEEFLRECDEKYFGKK